MEWIVLGLGTIGWAKLLAVVHNYFAALRISQLAVRLLKVANLVLLLALPFWVGTVIRRSPAALSKNPAILVWEVLSGVGLLLLLLSLSWKYLRPRAKSLIEETSELLSARKELGMLPVGTGAMGWMTSLPANQQFELDISRKTIRCDRLPAVWDGLTILHLSDFHFRGAVDLPYFEWAIQRAAALDADLTLFSGDLLDNRRLIHWINPVFGRLKSPLGCFYVLGNHDWYLDYTETSRELDRLGWRRMTGEVALLKREWVLPNQSDSSNRSWKSGAFSIAKDGLPLLLTGSETPWVGGQPDLGKGARNMFHLHLSHSPDNIGWARKNHVDLMMAGHTHGGQVSLPFLGPVYSPSRYDVKYCGGTYQVGKTVLHVSRGLSGGEPYRFNCRPEITRLILKSGDSPLEKMPESTRIS